MAMTQHLAPSQARRRTGNRTVHLAMFVGFVMGCFVCTIVLLSSQLDGPSATSSGIHPDAPMIPAPVSAASGQSSLGVSGLTKAKDGSIESKESGQQGIGLHESDNHSLDSEPKSVLYGLRILVAIAAFDFSQLPHLEEVLDGYGDVAAAGAIVRIVIHATMPYPVTLIDLLNTRFSSISSDNLSIEINLVSPTVRLHLVDLHRPLFYDSLEDYDLFIYTEDDIRVTPKTVATYLTETTRLQELVGKEAAMGFNVGIVRYEYNFPKNVEITDKTRHATQNVTRVYWEHSQSVSDPVPKAVDVVTKNADKLQQRYVHMRNHHQGMFLATRDLLKAWKANQKCQFDVVTNRPGKGSQPTEGTQRVWMSSQQLYAGRHCGIQQVLPIDRFGALTCWHLPNKNYRRVGHFHNRTFSDGTETFDHGSAHLLTAMALHLELRRLYPQQERTSESSTGRRSGGRPPYSGITMVDNIDRGSRWTNELRAKFDRETYLQMVDRRMRDFEQYASRGGFLSTEDMSKTALVDI